MVFSLQSDTDENMRYSLALKLPINFEHFVEYQNIHNVFMLCLDGVCFVGAWRESKARGIVFFSEIAIKKAK